MKLAGLKILVTRPREQQQAFVELLQQAGAEPTSYPVLAIQPLDPELDQDIIQHNQQLCAQLDHYRHIIFISTNAVQYGLQWLTAEQLNKRQCYAIGAATAKALQQSGVSTVAGKGAMNSEALLGLPELARLNGEGVLVVRGVGGREQLQQQLAQRGAAVEYLQCYRRCLPDVPQGELAALIKQQDFDVVCVHSGESLQNLIVLLANQSDLIKHTPLLLPGQRVAEQARSAGFEHRLVADNATGPAMLAALQQMS